MLNTMEIIDRYIALKYALTKTAPKMTIGEVVRTFAVMESFNSAYMPEVFAKMIGGTDDTMTLEEHASLP